MSENTLDSLTIYILSSQNNIIQQREFDQVQVEFIENELFLTHKKKKNAQKDENEEEDVEEENQDEDDNEESNKLNMKINFSGTETENQNKFHEFKTQFQDYSEIFQQLSKEKNQLKNVYQELIDKQRTNKAQGHQELYKNQEKQEEKNHEQEETKEIKQQLIQKTSSVQSNAVSINQESSQQSLKRKLKQQSHSRSQQDNNESDVPQKKLIKQSSSESNQLKKIAVNRFKNAVNKTILMNKKKSKIQVKFQETVQQALQLNYEQLNQCAICFSTIDNIKATIIECKHKFCGDCLVDWGNLQEDEDCKFTCPYDRSKINMILLQNQQDKNLKHFRVHIKDIKIPKSCSCRLPLISDCENCKAKMCEQCSQCVNCKGKTCSNCNSKCSKCSCIICDDEYCYENCELCGDVFCKKCGILECEICKDQKFCNQCQASCVKCQKTICENCTTSCTLCEIKLCQDCLKQMKSTQENCVDCGDDLCQDCYKVDQESKANNQIKQDEVTKQKCEICSFIYCEGCSKCQVCSKNSCNNCQKLKCEKCDQNICKTCVTICQVQDCKRQVCLEGTCSKKCEKCQLQICQLHRCRRCRNIYCPNCEQDQLQACSKCLKLSCNTKCIFKCNLCQSLNCDPCLIDCEYCKEKECEMCDGKEQLTCQSCCNTICKVCVKNLNLNFESEEEKEKFLCRNCLVCIPMGFEQDCKACNQKIQLDQPHYYCQFKKEFVCKSCGDFCDENTNIFKEKYKYHHNLVYINMKSDEIESIEKFTKNIFVRLFGYDYQPELEEEVSYLDQQYNCDGCDQAELNLMRWICLNCKIKDENNDLDKTDDHHLDFCKNCIQLFLDPPKQPSNEEKQILQNFQNLGHLKQHLTMKILHSNGNYHSY